MSSGVALSAGSLLGKQNLWALLADLKFSSRNVNRADRAIPGSGKGFLVQSCWEWLLHPLSLPGGHWAHLCFFPLTLLQLFWDTEIPGVVSPHGVCWWSCSSEPVEHLYCPSKPYVGMFWSFLNLSYQFKLQKCLTEQGSLAKSREVTSHCTQ